MDRFGVPRNVIDKNLDAECSSNNFSHRLIIQGRICQYWKVFIHLLGKIRAMQGPRFWSWGGPLGEQQPLSHGLCEATSAYLKQLSTEVSDDFFFTSRSTSTLSTPPPISPHGKFHKNARMTPDRRAGFW